MIGFCQDESIIQPLIEMLIERAWTQQKFTRLYAQLTNDLGNQNYPWDLKTNESEKGKFKISVINLVRKEFFQGFNKFKEFLMDLESNDKMDDTAKFEQYLKRKNRLMGNMSFIAELFLLKY